MFLNTTPELDPAALDAALDAVHRAGMPGLAAEVRAGDRVWSGAAGVADLETGRPVTPDMRHRVGSLTKTFTAAAVLLLVERDLARLDAPVGDLVPGARGARITVRMLLNHTSGIPEYLFAAFPSLRGFPFGDFSTRSLDDNRFRHFPPSELIGMGLAETPASGPSGVYSNANYLLLGELLRRLTGVPPEEFITREVIERAGLRHTGFPEGPRLTDPHPRMYEAFYGHIDPPRDYSEYDMSWTGTGAALVSTPGDLNRFYRALLAGEIVGEASLEQMRRTVPVLTQDGQSTIDYGLGLHKVEVPGQGTFWGHDGTVWGAQAQSLTSADGMRQMSIAMNLARWKPLGSPEQHPIDTALADFYRQALGGTPHGA